MKNIINLSSAELAQRETSTLHAGLYLKYSKVVYLYLQLNPFMFAGSQASI